MAAIQNSYTQPVSDMRDKSWLMIQSLLGGTYAMRQAGEIFLPKAYAETINQYGLRLKTSFLHDVFSESVASLSGKPFTEPLKINDDVPDLIKEICNSADMINRNLHSFARSAFFNALAYGVTFIWVDMPGSEVADTNADIALSIKDGSRPYLFEIPPSCLIDYSSVVYGNCEILTSITFFEEYYDGDDIKTKKRRIRKITKDSFAVFEKSPASKGEYVLAGAPRPNRLGYLPVIPVLCGMNGRITDLSPLNTLAMLNVEHWQRKSTFDSNLNFAEIPILVRENNSTTEPLTISTKSTVDLSSEEKIYFVEHAGTSMQYSVKRLERLEEMMRQAGGDMLRADSSGRTRTDSQMDAIQSISKILSCTLQMEDAINIVLQVVADWMLLPEGGTVELYKGFVPETTDAEVLKALQTMRDRRDIGHKTYINVMKTMGVIPSDLEYSDIKSDIEDDPMPTGVL